MNSPDPAIRNYINGNLSDARQLARRVKAIVIYQALRARYGKSETAAAAIANYLKGHGTFQAACDADQRAERRRLLLEDWQDRSREVGP